MAGYGRESPASEKPGYPKNEKHYYHEYQTTL